MGGPILQSTLNELGAAFRHRRITEEEGAGYFKSNIDETLLPESHRKVFRPTAASRLADRMPRCKPAQAARLTPGRAGRLAQAASDPGPPTPNDRPQTLAEDLLDLLGRESVVAAIQDARGPDRGGDVEHARGEVGRGAATVRKQHLGTKPCLRPSGSSKRSQVDHMGVAWGQALSHEVDAACDDHAHHAYERKRDAAIHKGRQRAQPVVQHIAHEAHGKAHHGEKGHPVAAPAGPMIATSRGEPGLRSATPYARSRSTLVKEVSEWRAQST
jgi:hypothetical protein